MGRGGAIVACNLHVDSLGILTVHFPQCFPCSHGSSSFEMFQIVLLCCCFGTQALNHNETSPWRVNGVVSDKLR
jgi:hypothetical protein